MMKTRLRIFSLLSAAMQEFPKSGFASRRRADPVGSLFSAMKRILQGRADVSTTTRQKGVE